MNNKYKIIILSFFLFLCVGCGNEDITNKTENYYSKHAIDIKDSIINKKYKEKEDNSLDNMEKEEENTYKQIDNLDNYLFIGDSFFTILKSTIQLNSNNTYIYEKSGSMPNYWIDKVDNMEDNIEGDVILLIGVNGAGYECNKTDIITLIDKLSKKYNNNTIYVLKIFPVGNQFKKVNTHDYNEHIKNLNDIVYNRCKNNKDNIVFIDSTDGFVDDNGELINTTDGLHIDSGNQQKFYDNIIGSINKYLKK